MPDPIQTLIHENLPVAMNQAHALLGNLRMQRQATLIFNPVAGPGDPKKDKKTIMSLLEKSLSVTFKETTPEVDAFQLAKEAVDNGAELVLAAGGDGTVAQVARAVVNTDVVLGILPRGTANALATAVFGSSQNSLIACCEAVVEGRSRRIDTAKCGDDLMLLLAGIGLEAGMVERADRESKKQFGVLAYLVGGWEQICAQEEFEVEIDCDGHHHKFLTASLVIANAAPPGSLFAQGRGEPLFDDGLLDVTALINVQTAWEAVETLLDLLGAALSESGGGDRILHLRAKSLRVSASPKQKLVVDGEICGTTPVSFSVQPRSLRLISP